MNSSTTEIAQAKAQNVIVSDGSLTVELETAGRFPSLWDGIPGLLMALLKNAVSGN